MVDLIQFGWFASSSGFQLPWKVDCDALTDGDIEAIAKLIRWKFAFGNVIGIPSGGLRLANALMPFTEAGYPTLIVDDVLTTGSHMRIQREMLKGDPCIGVVIFARCPQDGGNLTVPDWVWPIFTVNEWAQSRATGLG